MTGNDEGVVSEGGARNPSNSSVVHCSPKTEMNASAPNNCKQSLLWRGLKEVCCSPREPFPRTSALIIPMNSIRQRFLQAEDDFLSTLRLDNKHLVHFAERWQTLWSDWESCLPEADHDTRELVDEVVAKIEELAGDLYLLESRTVDLKDDLLNSLEDVFASLTLEDNVVAQPDPPLAAATAIISSPMQRDTISPPQWLLHNLHNPYPLPHIQFSTGRFASSKHTKGWFSKARQRIGWTRLLRDRFAGCRSLAIAAAFRAFIRDDPDNPLDDDLKTAFLAIKSHAELVYRGEVVVCKPPPKRLRSISPTPSLTFSSASEDTDEPWPTSPFESSFKRSCKRASLELSDSPSPKRRRFVFYYSPILHR